MNDFQKLNRLAKKELMLQPRSSKKLWPIILAAVIIIGLLIWLAPNFQKKRTLIFSNKILSNIPPRENDLFISDSTRIFLILGIPGDGNDAPNLTDSILLASLPPHSKGPLTLVSFPRDLLVKIPGQTNYAKLNALYALGLNNPKSISLIKQKIEEISGIKINHYFIVDLQLIQELINQIGGLNVLVEKDIYDTRYPGPNHSYQTFSLSRGWRYFDGATALQYIRSRYSTSDFDRINRQQQIITAAKVKLASYNSFWNFSRLFKIFQVFSSHIQTDLNPWQTWSFWQTAKEIPADQIKKYTIDETFLIPENIILNQQTAAVLKPRPGLENYSVIQAFLKKILF